MHRKCTERLLLCVENIIYNIYARQRKDSKTQQDIMYNGRRLYLVPQTHSNTSLARPHRLSCHYCGNYTPKPVIRCSSYCSASRSYGFTRPRRAALQRMGKDVMKASGYPGKHVKPSFPARVGGRMCVFMYRLNSISNKYSCTSVRQRSPIIDSWHSKSSSICSFPSTCCLCSQAAYAPPASPAGRTSAAARLSRMASRF